MHSFEFVEQNWVPSSIHNTELELLEICMTQLRSFFGWVSNQVSDYLEETNFKHVVELGAGTAPIVKLLAQDSRTNGLELIACDLIPQVEVYRALQNQYPEKVRAILSPVDFSKPYKWEPSTLLLIVSSFHHIPPKKRLSALENLTQSADKVMVFEALHNNLMSVLLAAFGAIIASALLPILWFDKPGRVRRIFWCWLLPVASLMFIWDSIISSKRMWNDKQWYKALEKVVDGSRIPKVKSTFNSQLVIW